MAGEADRPLSVTLVSSVSGNPYVSLMEGGLGRQPDVSAEQVDALRPGWIWGRRKEIDVVHLHWAELLVASWSRKRALKRLAWLASSLAIAKAQGIRVVYTVHNLQPHDGARSRISRLAERLALAAADRIHAHDEGVAQSLRSRVARPARLYVAPHPSYIGAYPNETSRTEARARLGVDRSSFVCLSLGWIRPYKGLDDLIAAFARVEGSDYALVVAGQPVDSACLAGLQAMARSDPRVQIRSGYVPDADVQYYMAASDVCVLPYREFTTSGAALLAFSFGKPIVAPRRGGFAELVVGERGRLFDPALLPDSLAEAIRSARTMDAARARLETLEYAEGVSWDRVAALHVAAYRSGLRGQG